MEVAKNFAGPAVPKLDELTRFLTLSGATSRTPRGLAIEQVNAILLNESPPLPLRASAQPTILVSPLFSTRAR
jgi:hypothetical protein